MNKIVPMTIALLLLCAEGLAKWSGSASLDGGFNFIGGNAENVAAKVRFDTTRFYVGASAFGNQRGWRTTKQTSIYEMGGSNPYNRSENEIASPQTVNAGGGLDFGYRFNALNALDASASYAYERKSELPELRTERDVLVPKDTLRGLQLDSNHNAYNSIDFRLVYTRKFASRPRAELVVQATELTKLALESKTRKTEGEYYSRNRYYRTEGSVNDFDSRILARYSDAFDWGEAGSLSMTAGLDLYSGIDLDVYWAQTNVNGTWADSAAYNQSYFYNNWSTEPYVSLTYKFRNFDFRLSERVQVYSHMLVDKLDEKTDAGDFKPLFYRIDPENLLSGGISYHLSGAHDFSIDYARSIKRPDYKKLCTTLTIGGSEGEYLMGNPDLLPERSDNVRFVYSYTHDIFRTSLSVKYNDKSNTAEKVLDTDFQEELHDPNVKTLFTWVNTQRQQTLGVRLDMKMDAKNVKATIWSAYNQEIITYKTKSPKSNGNYELGIDLSASLNSSLTLSTRLMYVSAKEEAYSRKGEDVISSLRLTKTIIKGLDLFVGINDIVDKEKYEENWNEAGSYFKISKTRKMGRTLICGLSYKF